MEVLFWTCPSYLKSSFKSKLKKILKKIIEDYGRLGYPNSKIWRGKKDSKLKQLMIRKG